MVFLFLVVLFIWAWNAIENYVLLPVESGIRHAVVWTIRDIRPTVPADAVEVDGAVEDLHGVADDVAERVRDSVVTVYTWTEGGTFSPGRTGREPTGAGSGWIYAEGVVVTEVTGDGGQVRIGGELWSARAYDETSVIPEGARVDVFQIKGATALVHRIPELDA